MSSLHKRLVLLLVIAGNALFTALIAFGNISDYASNFEFVKHVLSMDTIFENSTIKYRAITHNGVHHMAYVFIIALEIAMAYLFLSSAVQLFAHLKHEKDAFNAAKKNAFIGVGLGISLWFIGFTVVGGEWFGMWQSSTWNGLETAGRITTLFMLTYLALIVVD